MEKIVIYSSDYIGHIMECIGIAEYLATDGYKVIFSFITYPRKKAYDLLISKGMEIDISSIYIKAAIKLHSYNELMGAVVHSVSTVLLKHQPKLVICDADNIVPLICRKMGIKSASVKRTNIPTPIAYKQDFRSGVLVNKLIKPDELNSLCELVEGDIQLVPHSEFFFKINSKRPYYYCPKEFTSVEVIKESDKCDILCVLSTAYDMGVYKDALVDAFKNTDYHVLICYPQAHEDGITGNVRITKWADVDDLIKTTNLVISTGGHGIMTKAILNKKLQIILEVNELFAVYYGNKLEEHMLGVFLRMNNISKESIGMAADELYLNDYFQMHVNFMSETIKNLGGLKIDDLLKNNG